VGKVRRLPVWVTLPAACLLGLCIALWIEPWLGLWYLHSNLQTQAMHVLSEVCDRRTAGLIRMGSFDQLVPWGLAIFLGLVVGAIARARLALHALSGGMLAFVVCDLWYAVCNPGWYSVIKPEIHVLKWSARVFACVIVWLTSRWVYARRRRSGTRGMPVCEDGE